jgi:hypothetical protein
MIAYHKISSDKLEDALTRGLDCTSRGAKGADESIKQADAFLDDHRPAKLVEANVSRNNNLYAYVASDEGVVDIQNGKVVSLQTFIEHDDQISLRITVDPQKCYVSDLDQYDRVKRALQNNEAIDLSGLAKQYWASLIPLRTFTMGAIERPEIMITYSIPPQDIEALE